MKDQHKLNLENTDTQVDQYEFEPIKGYPMLNWKGKRPFTSTQFYPAQEKEVYGEEKNGWLNKIFWGDNLQVMSHLLKEYRGKVDLIYIDPPFDSKADYKKSIKLKGKNIVSNSQSAFEEKQYTDIWAKDEYLQFIYERLVLMRELLSRNGVLCIHCDWHKSHYLRAILDEIFGINQFQNEIVWHYYNKMQGNINRFASNHDVILVYSKSEKFTFNKLREKREKPVKQIKRVWNKETQSLKNAKDENGNVIYITSTHRTIDDIWRLPMLQPADKKEVVGYPTQKPEMLLERIILAFSNPGDLIFDSFMGSATTQVVATKYGRRFIGSDINLGAVQTATKRLLKLFKEVDVGGYIPSIKNGLNVDKSLADDWAEVFKTDKYYTGMGIFNVNNYDIFRNPTEAKELLLEALEIQKLENSIYDGEKDGRKVKIMPVNRIATRADLNELIFNFPTKQFDRCREINPTKPVESLLLVCMGHEPDLAAQLEQEAGYKLDIEVVDILRDRGDLQFKRDSEARIVKENEKLEIKAFYPMNLMQKLSMQKEQIEDWRELVESIMIDWNYDGAAMEPTVIDIPEKNEW
ncbi:MAG: site-specific DNA-methyltransferase, partial [Methylococcaceae bacterium]